jgi:hypothetical protein
MAPEALCPEDREDVLFKRQRVLFVLSLIFSNAWNMMREKPQNTQQESGNKEIGVRKEKTRLPHVPRSDNFRKN